MMRVVFVMQGQEVGEMGKEPGEGSRRRCEKRDKKRDRHKGI